MYIPTDRQMDTQIDVQTETDKEGAEVHRTIRVAVMSWFKQTDRQTDTERQTHTQIDI